MMEATVKQIQRLDKRAIEQGGIPSLVLMENAGGAVAREALKLIKPRQQVCVVCGTGNNAGDGFVAARYLINLGCRVVTVIIGDSRSLKNDALTNYRILRKARAVILKPGKATQRVVNCLERSAVTIDAIFGVGLNRPIVGLHKEFIQAINLHAKKVMAVDTPSGLDATTGKIHGICVRADKTVTFTLPKKGFKKNQGPEVVGKVVVVDIGIPKAFYKSFK